MFSHVDKSTLLGVLIAFLLVFAFGFFTHKAIQSSKSFKELDNTNRVNQVSLDTIDIYLIFKDTLYVSYTLSWENDSQREGGEIPILPGDWFVLRDRDEISVFNYTDSVLTLIDIKDGRFIIDRTYSFPIKEGEIYKTEHFSVYAESVYID